MNWMKTGDRKSSAQARMGGTTMGFIRGKFLRHTVSLIYAVSLVVILGSTIAAAQSVNVSQVTGVIHDSTGAAIPGATITLTKTDTGLERTVISGEDGAYSIPGLPVGPY